MMPPPPPTPPRVARGGYLICTACGLVDTYCRCGQRPLDAPSKDARSESDLNRRIRETQIRAVVVPPGFVLFCGSCGCPIDGLPCGCRS